MEGLKVEGEYGPVIRRWPPVKSRSFGRTGVGVPVLGQGTWMMESSPVPVIAALRRGLSLGMTHIDTAEMYGSGRVEEIVGDAIVGRRDGVFLVTKVLPTNATYAGTMAACERSLRRLRTDFVDVILLHWPGEHPLEDTVRAFEKLVGEGKARAWGVSNFDVAELDEAIRIAGPGRIACNQVLYHLEERGIERGVLPWCEKNDVAVVAYSPLGAGRFPAPSTPGGRALAAVARAHGATPRQVALAFLTRRSSVFAIPKAARVEHIEENAVTVKLTPDDIEAIDRAFPPGPPGPLATA